MKKWISMLMGLCLILVCLSLLATDAQAAEVVDSGNCGNNLTWTLDDKGQLTISGTGDMAYWGYFSEVPWYSNRSSVKTVILQNGVTSIGEYAFYGCSSLTSISIPNGVASIGEYAFYGCSSLTSVTIPDGVTSIGWRAFYECSSLTSVTIPDSVASIGDLAFSSCSSLTSISIPNSVTTIGGSAFSSCSSLTSISIPNSVTTIGGSAFSSCSSLTSISIPNSVTSIGEYAFYGCSSLTSITIPNSVTSIGDGAFWYCSSLTGFIVSKDNKVYSSDASGVLFNKSKTTLICSPGGKTGSYVIPNSVTTIESYAFNGCSSLTSISIPNSVTNICRFAFETCTSLTSISIPNSVTSIGDGAFDGCSSLTSISIPDSVTSIGSSAFVDCSSLTGFVVSKDNKVYSNDASGVLFNKSKTTLICFPGGKTGSYVIPNSVTSIGDYAFYNCSKLTSITIPDSVTSIGAYAFYGCEKLQHVAYSGTKAQWNQIEINGYKSFDSLTICYQAQTYWKDTCPTETLYCTGCKKYIFQSTGTHSYTKTIINPTLTTNGYTILTCKGCGRSYVEDYTFPDVPKSLWSYNAVEFAVAKGYFSGYASGKFGPTDNISRQDFVVVLARIAKVDLKKYTGRTGFPDVQAGSYYEAAVKWASSTGVVSGYNNGKFGVGDKITREQLVTILYRYAQKKGYDTKVSSGAAAKLSKFADAGKVTSYAKTAVIWALDKGIISGMTSTTVGPQNNASRGQVATILMNISKKNIMPI